MANHAEARPVCGEGLWAPQVVFDLAVPIGHRRRARAERGRRKGARRVVELRRKVRAGTHRDVCDGQGPRSQGNAHCTKAWQTGLAALPAASGMLHCMDVGGASWLQHQPAGWRGGCVHPCMYACAPLHPAGRLWVCGMAVHPPARTHASVRVSACVRELTILHARFSPYTPLRACGECTSPAFMRLHPTALAMLVTYVEANCTHTQHRAGRAELGTSWHRQGAPSCGLVATGGRLRIRITCLSLSYARCLQ